MFWSNQNGYVEVIMRGRHPFGRHVRPNEDK